RREWGTEFEPLEPLPRGTERILIVDDEEIIVEIAQRILKSLGYKVTAQTDCPGAWEMLRNHPLDFDLVITDMTMPHMTGMDLAKEYLAIRPDGLIILCTGFSEQADEEKAKAIGVREFVMKPIIKKDFARIVRKVLDGSCQDGREQK
ncbi:MAG: response regulator, partial [Desulfobulbaceae bacterium]|nr:response regulator [Desulfobulbaceae bacterium]